MHYISDYSSPFHTVEIQVLIIHSNPLIFKSHLNESNQSLRCLPLLTYQHSIISFCNNESFIRRTWPTHLSQDLLAALHMQILTIFVNSIFPLVSTEHSCYHIIHSCIKITCINPAFIVDLKIGGWTTNLVSFLNSDLLNTRAPRCTTTLCPLTIPWSNALFYLPSLENTPPKYLN